MHTHFVAWRERRLARVSGDFDSGSEFSADAGVDEQPQSNEAGGSGFLEERTADIQQQLDDSPQTAAVAQARAKEQEREVTLAPALRKRTEAIMKGLEAEFWPGANIELTSNRNNEALIRISRPGNETPLAFSLHLSEEGNEIWGSVQDGERFHYIRAGDLSVGSLLSQLRRQRPDWIKPNAEASLVKTSRELQLSLQKTLAKTYPGAAISLRSRESLREVELRLAFSPKQRRTGARIVLGQSPDGDLIVTEAVRTLSRDQYGTHDDEMHLAGTRPANADTVRALLEQANGIAVRNVPPTMHQHGTYQFVLSPHDGPVWINGRPLSRDQRWSAAGVRVERTGADTEDAITLRPGPNARDSVRVVIGERGHSQFARSIRIEEGTAHPSGIPNEISNAQEALTIYNSLPRRMADIGWRNNEGVIGLRFFARRDLPPEAGLRLLREASERYNKSTFDVFVPDENSPRGAFTVRQSHAGQMKDALRLLLQTE